MARSLVQDIVELGRALEAASATVARKDSLEQACREAEARLKSLRDEESKAGASIAAAHGEAEKIVSDARSAAYVVASRAESEAALKWNDCETRCAALESEAKAKAKQAEARAAAAAARCSGLEKEEAKLGQSVASLRADLAALRARLG